MLPAASGKTPPPNDENKLKKWVKNVLQRLANALSRLAGKAAAALPGIIGSVIGAVLNYLSKAVGLFLPRIHLGIYSIYCSVL